MLVIAIFFMSMGCLFGGLGLGALLSYGGPAPAGTAAQCWGVALLLVSGAVALLAFGGT